MDKKMKPVLVTTEYRGVFFGYMDSGDDLPASVNLENARNVVYWDSALHGFLGLAADGPSDKCRIGRAADITLYGVTCIANVSEAAVAKFERAPWK